MARSQSNPQGSLNAGNATEGSNIFVPGIIACLAILAFGALVIHAGLWAWLKSVNRTESGERPHTQSFKTAPRPNLQISPARDWLLFRATQDELLTNYGWIDRTAGLVRIPIAQAIERVLTNGLPNWGSTNLGVSPMELQRKRGDERGVQ